MDYIEQMVKGFLEGAGMEGGAAAPYRMDQPIGALKSPQMQGGQVPPPPDVKIGSAANGNIGAPPSGGGMMSVQGAAPGQGLLNMMQAGGSNTEALMNAAGKYQDTQSLRTKGIPGIGGALLNMGEMGFDAARAGGAREELSKQSGIAEKQKLAKLAQERQARGDNIFELAQTHGLPPEVAAELSKAGAADEDIYKKIVEDISGETFKDKTTEATYSREQRVEWAGTDEGRKALAGMSPAERRIFLATGQQMNKGATFNVNNPPPKDHVWKTNEKGEQYLEVIPGSPTDKKEKAAAQAMQNNWRRMTSNAQFMIEDAKRAFEETGIATAGVGSLLKFIPGTPAKDLEALLDTLRANIGFDRLQQMREASITGGALGNVSNREIELLYNSLAPLDQKQSPEQLKRSLQRVMTVYERMDRLGRDPDLRNRLEEMDDAEYWAYWDEQGLGRDPSEASRKKSLRDKY